MKNLRLLLFSDCDRNCEGCCNKDYDLESLEVEKDFTQYDKIILTGGEPTLKPLKILEAIADIRLQTNAPIILYTARITSTLVIHILPKIQGITLTLHTQNDSKIFHAWNEYLHCSSMRLNVFEGVELLGNYPLWEVKKMKWLKDCPIPQNEVFRRYE